MEARITALGVIETDGSKILSRFHGEFSFSGSQKHREIIIYTLKKMPSLFNNIPVSILKKKMLKLILFEVLHVLLLCQQKTPFDMVRYRS